MEGNASVYQVNPVCRITGEGRAEFLRTWGPDFDQKGSGRGGRGEAQVCYVVHLSIGKEGGERKRKNMR